MMHGGKPQNETGLRLNEMELGTEKANHVKSSNTQKKVCHRTGASEQSCAIGLLFQISQRDSPHEITKLKASPVI